MIARGHKMHIRHFSFQGGKGLRAVEGATGSHRLVTHPRKDHGHVVLHLSAGGELMEPMRGTLGRHACQFVRQPFDQRFVQNVALRHIIGQTGAELLKLRRGQHKLADRVLDALLAQQAGNIARGHRQRGFECGLRQRNRAAIHEMAGFEHIAIAVSQRGIRSERALEEFNLTIHNAGIPRRNRHFTRTIREFNTKARRFRGRHSSTLRAVLRFADGFHIGPVHRQRTARLRYLVGMRHIIGLNRVGVATHFTPTRLRGRNHDLARLNRTGRKDAAARRPRPHHITDTHIR